MKATVIGEYYNKKGQHSFRCTVSGTPEEKEHYKVCVESQPKGQYQEDENGNPLFFTQSKSMAKGVKNKQIVKLKDHSDAVPVCLPLEGELTESNGTFWLDTAQVEKELEFAFLSGDWNDYKRMTTFKSKPAPVLSKVPNIGG